MHTSLQSPAVPTTSTQPVITLAVTLSVVGGAVFLALVITGVAYLIWRCVHVSNARVAQRAPHVHDTHSANFTFPCIHIVHVQESPKVTRRWQNWRVVTESSVVTSEQCSAHTPIQELFVLEHAPPPPPSPQM